MALALTCHPQRTDAPAVRTQIKHFKMSQTLRRKFWRHKAPRGTMGNWRLCKAFALDHAHVAKMASVLGVRLLLVWPSKLSAWGVLIWGDVNVDCKPIMQLTGGGYRFSEAGETPGHVHRYCKWCRGRSGLTNQLVCFRSV